MTTLIVDDKNPQARKFLDFATTLPFIKSESRKQNFREAADECSAVTVDAFFDELNRRIEKWPDHA